MTNQTSTIRNGSLALAALVFLALIFTLTPVTANATEIPYDYIDASYPMDFGGGYGGGYDYIDTSYSSDSSSYSPYYSSYYPSSYSSYMPYSYPNYSTPSYSSSASSVFAPSNTCTAPNSCNDNSVYSAPTTINAPTTVTVTSPSYSTPSYSYTPPPVYYPPVYTPPTTYAYNPPTTYYGTTPYVSLSAVPYTGLELGPVGTFLYWSFLILWALIAAYLIVVKRVQIKLYRSLNNFLFGDMVPAKVAEKPLSPASGQRGNASESGFSTPKNEIPSVDPFIAAQLTRAHAR